MDQPNQKKSFAYTFIVDVNIDLTAFAAEYGVDLAGAEQMALQDAREWVESSMVQMNAAPKWRGLGAWRLSRS